MINKPFKYHMNQGFSLIELIVSVTLFTIVVAIASSSTFSLLTGSRINKDTQLLSKNIEVVVNDMVRNIRSGTEYHGGTRGSDCDFTRPDHFTVEQGGTVTSSPLCKPDRTENNFSFRNSQGDLVNFTRPPNDPRLIVRLNNPDRNYSIFDDSVSVENLLVKVDGGSPFDNKQPRVTIFMRVSQTDPRSGVTVEYPIQTTVTQRTLDIQN